MALASTGGWDLVYAVRLPKLNEQLAAIMPHANFTATIGSASVDLSVTGWRLVPGGSGYLVFVELDVAGKISATSVPAASFSGIAQLSVQLNYLVADEGTDDQRKLAMGGAGNAATQLPTDWATVRSVDLGPSASLLATPFVEVALKQWLATQPELLEHVFGVIDLSTVASEAPYAWLKPTSLSYAYCDGATERDCILAVLGMTGHRDTAHLAQQVAPLAMTSKADAVFLISPYLLVNDIILDALPHTFPGTTVEDFKATNNIPGLALIRELQLKTVTYDDEEYHPTLISLSITFDGIEIIGKTHMSVPIGDGVTAHAIVTSKHGLTVIERADGTQAIEFTKIGEPDIDPWHETDPTVAELQDAVGTAIIIGGIVASIFTAGIAGVLIVVSSAVIGGLLIAAPNLIAGWSTQTCPSIDLMAANITAPFQWTGGSDFQLISVDLAQSLRLQGRAWAKGSGGADVGL